MQFSNLSKRMKDYSDCSALTLEEVLGLMKMLCDDVRFESGVSVEKCAVKDWELMIDRLYSVSYTVNYIYKKQQKSISEYDAASAENALWQKLQNTENECGQVKEKLQQLSGLKKKLEFQMAEHAQLQAQLQSLQENEAHVGTQIQNLKAQIQEAKSAKQSAAEELASLRIESKAAHEDMDSRKKELEQAYAQKEKDDGERLLMEQQQLDVRKQWSAVRKKCDEADTEIETMKQLISRKQTEYVEKQAELKALEEQVSRITKCFQDLLSEIQKRKEQLDNTDKEKTEKELQAELETLQNQIDAYEATKSQIALVKEQISQETESLNKLRQERDRLLNEKENREAEYTHLDDEKENLKEALCILDSVDFKNRVERCQNQLDIMRMLREKMGQSVKNVDCGWAFDPEQRLREQLSLAEEITRQLRDAIQQYGRLWQSELNAMA